MPKKYETVSLYGVRIPIELKKEIERLAIKEDVEFNQFIQRALEVTRNAYKIGKTIFPEKKNMEG